MPTHKLKPMLTTLVDKPFDDPAWIFEPKYDGFRATAVVEYSNTALYSRNLNEFKQFKPINKALEKIPVACVLDGEIVVETKGLAKFQLLQNYQKTEQGNLVYYAFDILFLKNRDLRHLPLIKRKKLLTRLVRSSPRQVRISPYVEKAGKAYFKKATRKKWEGIIAKQKNSVYLSGKRTRFWLKIKTYLRQEAIIVGFTEPTGSRRYFGALLLGVYEKDRLKFVGHTGSGFNEDTLKTLHAKLKPLITKTSVFKIAPKSRTKAYWVKPKLICEVSFAEWTSEGVMRQAIFQGLREDKKPQEVHREKPKDKGALL